MYISVPDTAEILITDPSGNQTGFAPSTGIVVENIQNSVHFVDSLQNDLTGNSDTQPTDSVYIMQPAQGVFVVQFVGLLPGLFSAQIKIFNQDGSPQSGSDLTGIVAEGTTSTFQLTVVSTPAGMTQLVRTATFDSTLADISVALQQGLIDNQGIANSLAAKIQTAASAGALSSKGIIAAFENELQAQSGKHVDPSVALILKQDADFLIGQ